MQTQNSYEMQVFETQDSIFKAVIGNYVIGYAWLCVCLEIQPNLVF